MRFNVFIIPAIATMAAALPTEASTGGDLVARDEYRWCLGEKINMGTLRKFNWRMRGIDTDKVCQNDGPFEGIKKCLRLEGCAPSSGGFNCGLDAPGFAHGGVNVGLGCDGSQIKRCLDQELGISGNTDYVCNTTG